MNSIKTKTFLFFVSFISFSLCSYAQNLAAGFDFGMGSSYIVEKAQDDNSLNMKASFASGFNMKFVPKDAYFGVKLNMLYVSTAFEVSDLIWGPTYTGEISTFTTSLMLEHLNNDKKFNIGYNFGLGYTKENYEDYNYRSNTNGIRNFMSVTVSGIVSLKLGERSSLNLTPLLLWTDPINSFRTDNWYSAGEDVSFLVMLGYTYKLL